MKLYKPRIYFRVAEVWLNTFAGLFVLAAILGLLTLVSFRFGGSRVVLGIISSMLMFTVLTFIMTEVIVTFLTGARRATKEEHPRFHAAIERLFVRNGWWMKRPRLYVAYGFGNLPNAFAFGWGFLGQYAVAITPRLYEVMDDEELEAVLAHEIGHIRQCDVGLMSMIGLIVGISGYLSQSIRGSTSAVGRSLPLLGVALLLDLLGNIVLPFVQSAVMQMREFAADGLGALYMGSIEPLKRALRKLEEEMRKVREEQKERNAADEIFGSMGPSFPSHPEMQKRYERLDSYVAA